ncbi:MAG: CoA-binding protein [Desulfobacteraceae bacterium]|nr:CoA-binding protein [Desulfobacteraceae bacterium]
MPVSLPEIAAILSRYRRIAVVGLSPKEGRPSHQVARYLIDAGYTVIPVNPGHGRLLDRPCYPNLAAIPGGAEIVDIFRRPAEVPPIVEEAIAIGAKVIWMQEGIVHEEAARKAREAGLTVIMDRCLKVDHASLGPPPPADRRISPSA